MTVISRFPFFVTIAAVITLSALTASSAQTAAKSVGIRGAVTKMSPFKDGDVKRKPLPLIGLFIEGNNYPDTSHDKAYVIITDATTIKKLVGKELKDAKLDDIKQGCKVEVTFVGPVAEIYPVQASAGTIVILEDKK